MQEKDYHKEGHILEQDSEDQEQDLKQDQHLNQEQEDQEDQKENAHQENQIIEEIMDSFFQNPMIH